MRHKDEYIAELEARLEREVTEVAQVLEPNCSCMISCGDLDLEIQLNPLPDSSIVQVNDNFKKLVEIHEAQAVEVRL